MLTVHSYSKQTKWYLTSRMISECSQMNSGRKSHCYWTSWMWYLYNPKRSHCSVQSSRTRLIATQLLAHSSPPVQHPCICLGQGFGTRLKEVPWWIYFSALPEPLKPLCSPVAWQPSSSRWPPCGSSSPNDDACDLSLLGDDACWPIWLSSPRPKPAPPIQIQNLLLTAPDSEGCCNAVLQCKPAIDASPQYIATTWPQHSPAWTRNTESP